MSKTTFFRLLQPDDKGHALQDAISAMRDGSPTDDTHVTAPNSFRQVPGSPFAYWVSESIRRKFTELPRFEGNGRTVKQGLATADDFRFVRTWWEVGTVCILDSANNPHRDVAGVQAWCRQRTFGGKRWVPFAKGGAYSPYHADLHLVVNWERDGHEISSFERAFIRNLDCYFRPGLTWPLRSQRGLGFRTFPQGCVFGHKGPTGFAPIEQLSALLALTNSTIFLRCVSLQMAFGSYEVGVIQRTPVPELDNDARRHLGTLADDCVDLKRALDTVNETSHVFTLPALLQVPGDSLAGRAAGWRKRVSSAQAALPQHQQEIDDLAYRLYGITDEDRRAIEASLQRATERDEPAADDDDDVGEDQPITPSADQRAPAADILSYAVGCAFGRWDARVATDPSLAPALAGPFEPLPVCSPGTLIGPDGLPATQERIVSQGWLHARLNVITLPPESAVASPTVTAAEYPLPVAWDGILVDDDGHEADIVRRVRQALGLLFAERAEDWERDLCAALGVKTLREYLRHPNLFFAEHIARYSKSRRKAPIFWLLQSDKRNYALWLYCHRIGKDTLHRALNDYLAPKIALEERRLAEATQAQSAAERRGDGREARRLLKEQDTQEKLVAELYRFRDALKAVADRGYDPELDDGVVLSIAPLHALVPWKDAGAYWKELLAGKYPWSSVSKQLRAKGLVRE